jgi:hypothetical protein
MTKSQLLPLTVATVIHQHGDSSVEAMCVVSGYGEDHGATPVKHWTSDLGFRPIFPEEQCKKRGLMNWLPNYQTAGVHMANGVHKMLFSGPKYQFLTQCSLTLFLPAVKCQHKKNFISLGVHI